MLPGNFPGSTVLRRTAAYCLRLLTAATPTAAKIAAAIIMAKINAALTPPSLTVSERGTAFSLYINLILSWHLLSTEGVSSADLSRVTSGSATFSVVSKAAVSSLPSSPCPLLHLHPLYFRLCFLRRNLLLPVDPFLPAAAAFTFFLHCAKYLCSFLNISASGGPGLIRGHSLGWRKFPLKD